MCFTPRAGWWPLTPPHLPAGIVALLQAVAAATHACSPAMLHLRNMNAYVAHSLGEHAAGSDGAGGHWAAVGRQHGPAAALPVCGGGSGAARHDAGPGPMIGTSAFAFQVRV